MLAKHLKVGRYSFYCELNYNGFWSCWCIDRYVHADTLAGCGD